MSRSADELEREVEASRARLDGTLDDLQARLNGPRLSANLADLRRSGSALNEGIERMVAVGRADPLPALLICAGAGLLIYEALRSAAQRRQLSVMPDPAGSSVPDRHLPENHPNRMHERLDDALEESFPGSDPISVRITK